MTTKATGRIEREARLRWVPIAKMRTSPHAQRDLNPSWVDHIVANLDLEQIGTPTVSDRDGHFWIMDGQHRIEALRAIGWDDQQIQCQVYVDLTLEGEAEAFLRLNDTKTVSAYAKFRVGVQAGRADECDIDRVVRSNGLVVSKDKVPGGIGAVAALRKVHSRAGAETLGRALRIIRDAHGDAGLESVVIEGIGLLCQRYNGDLDDGEAVRKLAAARGGVNGLLGNAEVLRKQTGAYKAHCVAAAAVDIINSGRGGVKMPSWWRTEA